MPISVMLKPASGNCNLRCKYCFYHDLAATRQTENKGYMTRDTALQVMDKALAFAGDGPVYFTFQGGEPLLAGKDFFRFFFSSCKERQRPGVTVQFCVQTNGTLLDDEWCDLFLEYGCLVGVSLDGDREGTRYRVYPDGRSSFDDVFRCSPLTVLLMCDRPIASLSSRGCATCSTYPACAPLPWMRRRICL